MSTRASIIVLVVLLLLSASLNVWQFEGSQNRVERWDKSFVSESLHRLSASRTILTDADNALSVRSLQRLHGRILVDLTRVRPNIKELGVHNQQRYQEILADLNKMRISSPDLFARDNTIIDDSMYSRYITWVTDGDSPE